MPAPELQDRTLARFVKRAAAVRALPLVLAGWVVGTSLGAVAAYRWSRIEPQRAPSSALVRWGFEALQNAGSGPAPGAYQGRGSTFIVAWRAGRVIARHEGPPDFERAVREAATAFRDLLDIGPDATLAGPRAHRRRLHFSITVTEGFGPIVSAVPLLSSLSVVPLVEGVQAQLGDRTAALTPDELFALGAFDAAVSTPIPDLSFGMDWVRVQAALARALGVEVAALQRGAALRRFRARTFTAADSAAREGAGPQVSGWQPLGADGDLPAPTSADLAQAARDGARFLLRHQAADGRFAYRYDARSGAVDNRGYNVVRHAGTAYFLGQAARLLGMPEAGRGALKALSWLEQHQLRQCGASPCVDGGAGPNVGATALAALAIAELLEWEATQEATRRTLQPMLEGFVSFFGAMQRADGELMHEYDLAADRPVDVQRLYFSGEAALALLRAHRVLGDPSALEIAQRLMQHVMGRHWRFLGSRYYFGEEHWTCMAVGEAADRLDVREGLDFCWRWSRFNHRLQYRGETAWSIEGAYGAGPLLLPRTTPAATRAEAFVSIWPLVQDARDRAALGAQIERALKFLWRQRFAPGPAHLLRSPAAAWGGMPKSPGSFEVRNDFVQHAGSAMLRWALRPDPVTKDRN